MSGWAFGAGFFDKLNKNVDDAKQEERDFRKMQMMNWNATVLPKVMEARQKDAEAVSRMNDYIADPRINGQPEKAFWAAKTVMSGQYRNLNELMDAYEKDPSIAPQSVLDAQKAALAKTFTYDVDPNTGKVTGNFAFKNQAASVDPNAMAPIPGTNATPSFWSKLGGKGDLGAATNEARGAFASSTGVDPMAPIQSRFNTAPMSGTLSLKPIDKRQEKYQDMAAEAAAQQAARAKNLPGLLDAIGKGPEALLDYAKKPGAFYSREELQSQEFTQGLRQTLLKSLLDGDFKDPNGAIKAIASGNVNFDTIMKGIRTPEEKAQLKALFPNDALGFITLMSQPAQFAKAFPDPKDRERIQNNFNVYMQQQTLSSMGKTLRDSSLLDSAGSQSSLYNFGDKPVTPPPAADAVTPDTTKTPPRQVPPELQDAVRIQPDTSEQPQQKGDLTASVKSKQFRLGDDPNSGQPQVNSALTAAVNSADEKTLVNANPFATIEAVKQLGKNRINDPKKVLSSLTFTDADRAQLQDKQFGSKFDKDLQQIDPTHDLAPKFNSSEEANAALPPGRMAYVKVNLGGKPYYKTIFTTGNPNK